VYYRHFAYGTGNHTIAAVKAKESYPALAQGFAEVIAEINSVQEEGDIDVGGCQHPLEFFLGGDYKVSQLLCTRIYTTLHGGKFV